MAKGKDRITGDMDMHGMIFAMCGGNPGALNVMVQLLQKTEAIDPDNALGGLGNILSLDTLRIYDDKIWMFYKDICGQDIITMIGVMRGVQLGKMSATELTSAINHPSGYGQLDSNRLADVLKQVREQLPNFAK